MSLMKSWVATANDPNCPFPLNNLPLGVFSTGDDDPRCGVAIGDQVLDARAAEEAGLLEFDGGPLLDVPFWNEVMEAGPQVWAALRGQLLALLQEGSTKRYLVEDHLVAISTVRLHMPFLVSEYTDFYAGRHHATNVGTMFRGAENALPPNWLHIPIGYNGRASSVVVSGTDVRRPWGQIKGPNDSVPRFAPSARFDIELEMGAVVGMPSDGPVSVAEADAMIFGYVLLNDWSARDIQAWEYVPLGPFLGKNFASSISAWIVTLDALEPFSVESPEQNPKVLPYLEFDGKKAYDIQLQVGILTNNKDETVVCNSNFKYMYWNMAQQLAHHTSNGCNIRCGDLLGSGTISGKSEDSFGSMLELTWRGTKPLKVKDGSERKFINDGDSVIMRGHSELNGVRIGFGELKSKLLPAK